MTNQQTIYKYLPIERLSYLDNELLRFTPPRDLNDPLECFPILPTKEEIISIIKIVAERNIKSLEKENLTKKERIRIKAEYTRKFKSAITAVRKDEPNNFGEQFFNRAITNLNTKIGIFSLSRRWDSTLMWAHYTNSHKGFCVGFDKNSEFFKPKGNPLDPTFSIQSVEYSANRIKVPIEEGVKIDPKILLTKSKDWQYEEEERIVSLLSLADKSIKSEPFNIDLFKIPHDTISEIIVGANISQRDYEVIYKFCKDKKVELYKSIVSLTKFDMTREKVK
jgi:hypothetical protein